MNDFHSTEPDLDHDRLRRGGEVELPDAAQRELVRLMTEIPDATERIDTHVRSVRHRRTIVGGVLAAGVIGGCLVAVPATATMNWAAQTGIFGNPDMSTEVDDTEWIDLGQGGAADVVAASYPDALELPPGARAVDAVAAVRRLYAQLADGNVQQGTIATSYETWAICAWEREWLDAFDVDDRARADSAARWLSNEVNFPLTRAHDGGGILDQLLSIGRSAVDGDRSAVQADYDRGCDRLLGGA